MSIQNSFNRRMGRFKIANGFFEDYPELVRIVTGNTTIVRAEYMFAENWIEYTAFCESFDIVPQGNECPWYSPVVDTELRQLIRWEKQ